MDSCGPSNGVKNLVQYSQRDNSIQNDVIRTQQDQRGQNTFRTGGGIDGNLNNEFKQFNEGNQFANQFMNQFNGQGPGEFHKRISKHSLLNQRFQPGQNQHQNQVPNQHQNHVQNHVQNQSNQMGNQWVNDFSNMNIQGQHPNQHQHPNQQVQPNQFNQRYQVMPNYTSFQMNTRSHLNTNYEPNTAHLSEHQEVHKLEMESQQFEKEFQEFESQMVVDNQNKKEFAETARKIHDSLSNDVKNEEMTSKLKESNFMKLMSSISTRQVELSDAGDKLIDIEGQDIRTQQGQQQNQNQDQTQTQTDINHDIDYHSPTHETEEYQPQRQYNSFPHPHPQHQQSQPQSQDSHVNTLPDPLSHIPDGSLSGITDPLQAARIVSGNQVQSQNWMEDFDMPQVPQRLPSNSTLSQMRQQEFDDYRHDDDYR